MSEGTRPIIFAWLIIAIFSRLIPHPPDTTAMDAMLVLAATQLPRVSALAAVLGTYILSNVGLVLIGVSPLLGSWWWNILACYIVLTLVLSTLPKKAFNHPVMLTVSTGLGFWLLSNLGTWLLSGAYPHTAIGLLICYTLALPFLPNQILGDALFASLVISSFRILRTNPKPQLYFK